MLASDSRIQQTSQITPHKDNIVKKVMHFQWQNKKQTDNLQSCQLRRNPSSKEYLIISYRMKKISKNQKSYKVQHVCFRPNSYCLSFMKFTFNRLSRADPGFPLEWGLLALTSDGGAFWQKHAKMEECNLRI